MCRLFFSNGIGFLEMSGKAVICIIWIWSIKDLLSVHIIHFAVCIEDSVHYHVIHFAVCIEDSLHYHTSMSSFEPLFHPDGTTMVLCASSRNTPGPTVRGRECPPTRTI
jgi:hypothetical protein